MPRGTGARVTPPQHGQWPAAALAAETALARAFALALVGLVGLLALGWRQAGIVGGLRRDLEPGFQFGKPLFRGMNAPP